MLIKAVTKALIFTMQQQPPHMGRIPIPTLIKADMEAAGPYAQRHSFSRWSSNLPHNIRNYIMQETSWMLPSTRDAQAARLPNHPANQPSIIQLECSYMPRAEQSRAKQRTMQAQIANTSHDIDYSIGRSMNRLWLRLRGTALHTSTSWFVWCIASCTIMLYILTGQESAGEEREVT